MAPGLVGECHCSWMRSAAAFVLNKRFAMRFMVAVVLMLVKARNSLLRVWTGRSFSGVLLHCQIKVFPHRMPVRNDLLWLLCGKALLTSVHINYGVPLHVSKLT